MAHLVIQGGFEHVVGAKAASFSECEFGVGVHTLDGGGGNLLLGAKPVEDQLAMAAQSAGHLLDGLEAGAHGPSAPAVEKPASPGGGLVGPEEAQALLEQVGAHGA